MSALHRNAAEWEANARRNPLWAILTDRDRTAQIWDLDEFFATGEREVGAVFRFLENLSAPAPRAGTFLDFGCGVGRATRALMRRFASGVGVDVSDTMIALARTYQAREPVHADFAVNKTDRLPGLRDRSVDFVYCHIVLQHLPRDLQPKFIAEFLRILAPGGVAAFQIPTGDAAAPAQRSWRSVKAGLRSALPQPVVGQIRRALGKGAGAAPVTMSMNVLPEAAIASMIEAAGCALLAAPYTNSTDTSHRGELRFMDRTEALAAIHSGRTDSTFLSQFFFVIRPAAEREELIPDAGGRTAHRA